MSNINPNPKGFRPTFGEPTAAPAIFPYPHDSLKWVDHDAKRRKEIVSQRLRARDYQRNWRAERKLIEQRELVLSGGAK